jgi:hypothetical protein
MEHMEIIGELNNTDLTIEIDLHDLMNEMNLTDQIEDGCRDYIDNVDFSDYINIDSKIEELLSQYDGMNNPCGLGKSFEKAVWWAMSRHTLFNEDVVRKIVREELRAILNMGVSRLDVQAKYKRVDDDTSNT